MGGFKVGDKVEHILSKDWLLILKRGREQFKCRTKDLREVWVYEWELREIGQ